MNALELFRLGYCYSSIAAQFGTTEAEIERQVHELRNAERAAASKAERQAAHAAAAAERRQRYEAALSSIEDTTASARVKRRAQWLRTKRQLQDIRDRRPA